MMVEKEKIQQRKEKKRREEKRERWRERERETAREGRDCGRRLCRPVANDWVVAGKRVTCSAQRYLFVRTAGDLDRQNPDIYWTTRTQQTEARFGR